MRTVGRSETKELLPRRTRRATKVERALRFFVILRVLCG
jgi:hypothetical protein